MQALRSVSDLEALRKSILDSRNPDKPIIAICGGSGSYVYGGVELIDAFKDELKARGLESDVDIRVTGCRGFCAMGKLLTIYPQGIFYHKVKVEDVNDIIDQTIEGGGVVDRLLCKNGETGERVVVEGELPFYAKQMRLLMDSNTKLDSTSIEDYLAIGGYSALAKVLSQMSPQEVIDEIKESKLRGRGGGGFPAGRKWESAVKAEGDRTYVIVNADEGDPGAYMDRSLLEGNPHSILEGLMIGAYAVGSHEGYIYVRNEYPLAVENTIHAIEQAEKHGLIGKDILGSGFDFTVRINRGGGAFVCGESTALMASLEGKAGEPRAKYVHTVEKGLWEQPTVLNNVETWANVPIIINRGADWYNSIGTEGSKGTKIFSLVGKVVNTGLVEVPMGTSLREIIFDIGGGINGGKKFKGVQTGGPSGGVIPEKFLDLPVDFDELSKVGSMMGSGGMVVMDEDTCMVDVAKYFIDFLKEESCGKCIPCREGLNRMGEVLTRITEGKGEMSDLDLLERISSVIKDSALCALGGSAPNPVLTTIKYFREEYEAHIKEKKCPGRVCKALITYSIDEEKCKGCKLCIKACPQEAISPRGKKEPVDLYQDKCIKCGSCYDVCKLDAIIVK